MVIILLFFFFILIFHKSCIFLLFCIFFCKFLSLIIDNKDKASIGEAQRALQPHQRRLHVPLFLYLLILVMQYLNRSLKHLIRYSSIDMIDVLQR